MKAHGGSDGPASMRTHSTTTSTKADDFRRVEVITGVGRRRRWTDEEKAWIVAESLDPATTVAAVARRYGLHASQLFVWRQQLAAPAACEGPAFVPVVVAESGGAAPAEMAGRMEIALGPAVIRVGADVDAAALRRVLEVVRGLR
jgi:transposase